MFRRDPHPASATPSASAELLLADKIETVFMDDKAKPSPRGVFWSTLWVPQLRGKHNFRTLRHNKPSERNDRHCAGLMRVQYRSRPGSPRYVCLSIIDVDVALRKDPMSSGQRTRFSGYRSRKWVTQISQGFCPAHPCLPA